MISRICRIQKTKQTKKIKQNSQVQITDWWLSDRRGWGVGVKSEESKCLVMADN